MTLAEAEEAPKVSFRPSFTTRLHVTTVGGVVVVDVAISMPIVNAVRVLSLPPSVCHLTIYSRYSGLKTTSACSLKRHSPFLLFCILGLARGARVAVAVVAIEKCHGYSRATQQHQIASRLCNTILIALI